MSGNGEERHEKVTVLGEDADGYWLDDPVVLVVSRSALRTFLCSLSRDWLGEQQEFYNQLMKATE